MKFFIILLIVNIATSFALTDEQKAKADEYGKQCINEIGAAPADVAKFMQGDLTNKNEKLQCLINCILEHAGFMKDGALQENAVIEHLSLNADKENIEKIVQDCKDSGGQNKCERAFNMYKCYNEHKASLS